MLVFAGVDCCSPGAPPLRRGGTPLFTLDGQGVLEAITRWLERWTCAAGLVRADNPALPPRGCHHQTLTAVLAVGSGGAAVDRGHVPPPAPGVNQVVDVGVLVIVTARRRPGARVTDRRDRALGGVGAAMTVQIFSPRCSPMSASPSSFVEILTVLVIMLALLQAAAGVHRKKRPQQPPTQ